MCSNNLTSLCSSRILTQCLKLKEALSTVQSVYIPWGWVFIVAEMISYWHLQYRTSGLGRSATNWGTRHFTHLSTCLVMTLN